MSPSCLNLIYSGQGHRRTVALLIGTAIVAAMFAPCVALPAAAQGVLVIENDREILPIPRPHPHPHFPPPRPTAEYRVKSLEIDASINDQVAQIQISQVFQNTGSVVANASFLFPLPHDAAIDHLTLMVDGKEYEGKLMPRDEARKIYEDYVRRSQDPALLEWMGFGLFQTSVFPIPPGAERTVTIEYSQLLRRTDSTTELLLPLATAKYSSQALDKLRFRIAIDSPNAKLKNVYCPTYSTSIERSDDHHALVSYEATSQVPGNDLRLFFDTGEELIGASMLSHWESNSELGHFLLLVSPDFGSAQNATIPKDIVFVVDRSGSMSGEKIEQVRQSLKFVIERLNPEDRFNIVTYSSSTEQFRPELELASADNKQAAIGFANGVFAGGSTNISQAMSTALPMLADANRPSFVVFLTDGLPTAGETNEGKIVEVCRSAAAKHVRILNLGVGYDVNSRLLERIATSCRGRSEYVRPSEDIETYVSRIYSSIAAPVMTDVSVAIEQPDWDVAKGPLTQQLIPSQTSDLFFGEQLTISGRYRAAGAVRVVVTGQVGTQTRTFEFPLQLNDRASNTNQSFVSKIWASRRIGEIINEIDLNGQQKELIDELVSLSMTYGIMTPYTSFLADDQPGGLAASGPATREQASDRFGRLDETSGRAGVAQRDFSNRLRAAGSAPGGGGRGLAPSSAPGQPAEQSAADLAFGAVELAEIDQDSTRAVASIRAVGTLTFYRSGNTWVAADCRDIDLNDLPQNVRRVGRFSDEYFELSRNNTEDENMAFSRLGDGERMLVRLRGDLIHVE